MNRSRVLMGVRVLAATTAVALGCAATASAGGNNYKLRLGPAGKAAAAAVMLSQTDLGGDWVGRTVKPDLSNDLRCPNFKPRVSDLVVNGAAKSKFSQHGFEITSSAQVLKTEKMVGLDVERSFSSPHFLNCIRTLAKRGAGNVKGELLSLRRMPVPRLGDFSDGIRMVIDYPVKSGGKMRMVIDSIWFTKGRTELTLTTTMPIGTVATMAPNEAVLAKLMLRRVRV